MPFQAVLANQFIGKNRVVPSKKDIASWTLDPDQGFIE